MCTRGAGVSAAHSRHAVRTACVCLHSRANLTLAADERPALYPSCVPCARCCAPSMSAACLHAACVHAPGVMAQVHYFTGYFTAWLCWPAVRLHHHHHEFEPVHCLGHRHQVPRGRPQYMDMDACARAAPTAPLARLSVPALHQGHIWPYMDGHGVRACRGGACHGHGHASLKASMLPVQEAVPCARVPIRVSE